MKIKEWGIYQIKFPNGKCYVGQSSDLERRIKDYKHWRKRCKCQTALYNAFEKYGFETVEITYLYRSGGILDRQKLNLLEQDYIKTLNTTVPNGYNIQSGGHKPKYKKFLSLEKVKKFFPGYWDEPVLDTQTNQIYDNVVDWLNFNKKPLDSYYDLYFDENGRYRFLNESELLWDLGSGTIPENSSIADVHNKKATVYIKA